MILTDIPKIVHAQVYPRLEPYIPSLFKLAGYSFGQQQIKNQRPARRVEYLQTGHLRAHSTCLSLRWSASQFYIKLAYRNNSIAITPAFDEFIRMYRQTLNGVTLRKIETAGATLELTDQEQGDMEHLFNEIKNDPKLTAAIEQATLQYGDI